MKATILSFCSLAMGAAIALGGSLEAPIGLQLYSLRKQFEEDVPGTLAKVRELGITEVELAGTYGHAPEEFRKMLEKEGLNAEAGHFDFRRFAEDPEGVAAEAKALGLSYAGCAWIPHDEGEFGEKDAEKAIEVFNRAGEVLKKEGIQFYYHIHGYEFEPKEDGRTLFDRIVEETDPEHVVFQLDTVWAVVPGVDPAELLEKYGDRWELLHLKDLRKGVETGVHTGRTAHDNAVVLGEGQIDWAALLQAAEKVGVKHYYLEDESSIVLEQLPRSIEYLKQLTW